MACGGARAAGEGTGARAQAGPQHPGSPLVSEVPETTDPHPHVRVTAAGVPVCTDPTHPRSHRPFQVFGSDRPHISMLSTVGRCYGINTRHDSRLSREDPKGKRQGELPRKPLCVTVTEAGDAGCEHVKVKDAL